MATIGGMLAAVVWHYWIAVVLVILAVIPGTLYVFAGFIKKTQSPKYGGDE
jgi:hypothetical protein